MGGRGSRSRITVDATEADTSYQGKKGFSRASGRGITVDMMAENLHLVTSSKLIAESQEAISTINAARGKPNAKITIYRATIGDSINPGDWVFLDKDKADRWTKTPMGRPKPGVKVLKMTVRANRVDWTGKNLEFVYLG